MPVMPNGFKQERMQKKAWFAPISLPKAANVNADILVAAEVINVRVAAVVKNANSKCGGEANNYLYAIYVHGCLIWAQNSLGRIHSCPRKSSKWVKRTNNSATVMPPGLTHVKP